MALPIDPTLAKSLIKEFRDQNALASGPGLTTPDGSPINGYFVDRKSLEGILADPDVVGISVEYAKHPDFAGQQVNIFTLIMVGAVPNTDPDATTEYKNNGMFVDQMPPCPPFCCSLD